MSDEAKRGAGALAGRHVVVTRPFEQAGALEELLAAAGARVTILPTIAIAPVEDTSALDGALGRLPDYDWVVLTSVNGVRAVAERLRALGRTWDVRGGARVAVIGPATARALAAAAGVAADYMPREYVAEAIAAGLGDLAGRRVLLLRADIARRALAEDLRAAGASVDEVAAYRTVVAPPEGELVRAIFATPANRPDAVTLTSSSTVQGLARGLEAAGLRPREALAGIALAAIGPITAQTLREHGLEPTVVADEYTIQGLVEALAGQAGAQAHANEGV